MLFFFFKQKTAYEMRISDWSSDVCSSDLLGRYRRYRVPGRGAGMPGPPASVFQAVPSRGAAPSCRHQFRNRDTQCPGETLDIVETDIALPAFDSAQIVAMNAGKIGQGLLAEFALTPKSPQLYCQHISEIGRAHV